MEAEGGDISGAEVPMHRLGDLEFDARSGEIWRDGHPVDLAPQPTRLFILLARRPGRLVTREEIQREIWGDAAVEVDTAINNAIREIRDALGDDAADPRYVETIPRRGYRLIAELEAEEDGVRAADAGAEGRPAWLWPAGVALIVAVALWLLPALLGSDAAPTTITVVPVRAGEAGSVADRLAEDLGAELEDVVRDLGEGRLVLVPWEGVVQYDPAARRLSIDGQPVEVDLALDAGVTAAADSLRVTVSLIGLSSGSQLWYRTFTHPVADTAGLLRRVRDRVSEELEARVGPGGG